MENVLNELLFKIEEIKKTPVKDEEELAFFEKFIKKNVKENFYEITNIKVKYFLLACIRLHDNKTSFSQLKNKIDTLYNGFRPMELMSMPILINVIKNKDIEKIINYIKKSSTDFKKINNEDIADYKLILYGLQSTFNDPEKQITFLRLIDKYKDSKIFEQILEFEYCLALLSGDKVKDFYNSKVKSQKNIYIKNGIFKEFKQIQDIVKTFDNFDKYIISLKKNIKSQNTNIIKEANKYEDLFHKLYHSIKYKKLNISNNELKFIEDEKFKQEIICAILDQNKSSYQELLEEYKSNNSKEINELDKILIKYNFVMSDNLNKILLLENINILDIENILIKLQSHNFNFIRNNEDLLTKILLFSDPDILYNINYLCKNNILTIDFISKNIGIFIKNNTSFDESILKKINNSKITPCYDTLFSNINLFLKNNILLQNIKKYDSNLFLHNHQELINNLDLINKYQIELDNPNLLCFSILEHLEQLEIVDNLIELDLSNIINSHIELINSDKNIIKRIILLKELEIPILDDNNNLLNIITGKEKFYIPDFQLDNYINNNTLTHMNVNCYISLSENNNNLISNDVLNNTYISELDKNNKVSENEYQFGEIIISRNKVLRNMTTLKNVDDETRITDKELLINSILYNSFLKEEEIQTIIDRINTMFLSEKQKEK